MAKRVYLFGGGSSEGKADMKNLLGGKGANLAEMSNLGIPVPAGFTITTEVCELFYKNDRKANAAHNRRAFFGSSGSWACYVNDVLTKPNCKLFSIHLSRCKVKYYFLLIINGRFNFKSIKN